MKRLSSCVLAAIVLVLSGCALPVAQSVALRTAPTAVSSAEIATTPRLATAPSSQPVPVAARATPAPAGATTACASSTLTETLVQAVTATAEVTATLPVTSVATSLPTPDGRPRTARVPILMYHYISVPPPGADAYRRDLSVTPERFEEQLVYLREHGYQAISLDDLYRALTQGSPLPPNPIILTFDDGYEDNYLNAFPLLKKHAMMGHFFIISDLVNKGDAQYMTWSQMVEMASAGQYFGSHSRNHPDLRNKPLDYVVWQALGGLEAIEEHLGYHPRWIAYPSGAYDARTIDVYQSANYWGGLTTKQGIEHSSDKLFELSRIRMRGRYTIDDFATVLRYKW